MSATPAPWIIDGEPDRWVTVSDFAILVKRRPATIYIWLTSKPEILRDFGYRAYRDRFGKWFIQVSRHDVRALKSIKSL